MYRTTITPKEFAQFQAMLLARVGIQLTPAKMPMVQSRLAKRLDHLKLDSYDKYFQLITGPGGGAELQRAIDMLTTNETYFFREPKHFDFLREQVLPHHRAGRSFRVWSAASSSGEEPYSIAMTLADRLGDSGWEVIGSDISTRVLERAVGGQYPMTRIEGISKDYLRRFCLKGIGRQEGTFLVMPELRRRVQFVQVNLNESLPDMGEFDVVFLRNVMIYFNQETKAEVVRRIVPLLRQGGYLFIGHSESLNGVNSSLKAVMPAVYRRA